MLKNLSFISFLKNCKFNNLSLFYKFCKKNIYVITNYIIITLKMCYTYYIQSNIKLFKF